LTIIILEGVNGTGKSMYAKKLAGAFQACVMRPFRQHEDHHFNGETTMERDLKALGVPYNTHVDELYVADFLGKLHSAGQRPSVVLDRSIGSAVAHGDRPISDAGKLINTWYRLLGENAPVLYVWLTAPWHVAHDRLVASGRGGHGDDERRYDKLCSLFRHAYDLVPFPKMRIDTGVTLVEEGVHKVIDQVLDR
jgi:thymidylate kinase